MKRREKIKFKIGTESVQGIVGLVLSILVLLGTVSLVVISVKNAGYISLYYAAFAVAANILAIIGFILALRALLYVKDVRPTIPVVALILNGITVLFYIFIYIVGL